VSATGVRETVRLRQLSQALGRLFALTEAIRSQGEGNVASCRRSLPDGEQDRVCPTALQRCPTQYNTSRCSFPKPGCRLRSSIAAELWEIEAAGERAVPAVDLS